MGVSDTRGQCVTCGAVDGVRCEPWCPISGGPGKAQWSIDRVRVLEAQLRAADALAGAVRKLHQAEERYLVEPSTDERLMDYNQANEDVRAALAGYDAVRKGK